MAVCISFRRLKPRYIVSRSTTAKLTSSRRSAHRLGATLWRPASNVIAVPRERAFIRLQAFLVPNTQRPTSGRRLWMNQRGMRYGGQRGRIAGGSYKAYGNVV